MNSAPSELLRARIAALRTWRRGGQQAVHKPLLLLYALGRNQQGSERLLPFSEIDRHVKPLLERFGPIRTVHHPEYPFWRLQNGGIWEEVSDVPLRSRKSNSAPPRSEFLAKGAKGGFKDEMFAALTDEQHLIGELSLTVLMANFPADNHLSILAAVGIQPTSKTQCIL
jgi:putative restriction endonuclease